MTLTSSTNRVQYSGDGSTVSFPVTFVFWDADDLQVILTSSSGVETTWVRGTQYTVSGGSGSTGTVTVDTSPTDYTPASGTTLTIKSNLSDFQNTDLAAGGPFPASSVEQQLDKIVRLVQQKAEALGRAIKFRASSTSTNITMPEPSANKVVGWNSGGTDLENKTPNTSAYVTLPSSATNGGIVTFNGTSGTSLQDSTYTITAAGAALIDDATAAAQRTTLGLAIGTDVQAYGATLTSLEGLSLANGDIIYATAADTLARLAAGTNGHVLTLAGGVPSWAAGGKIAQVVRSSTSAVATGTTTIPLDDTVPQNTEGDEYLTATIVPTNASSTLVIFVSAQLAHSSGGANILGALFRDTTASAVKSAWNKLYTSADSPIQLTFQHSESAASTASTTFKLRLGSSAAGTTTVNGLAGARYLGGSLDTSITIFEVLP